MVDVGRSMRQEVMALARQFAGQQAPGRWFNREEAVTLPAFTEVRRAAEHRAVDVVCSGESVRWIVKVMPALSTNEVLAVRTISFGIGFAAYSMEARPWVIVRRAVLEPVRAAVREMPGSVLLTGPDGWAALCALL